MHYPWKEIYTIIALKEQIAGVASTETLQTGQICSSQVLRLPVEIIAELKPIYQRLSVDALLTRFLDGKTQNQNESLDGMIWNRVPKEVFVGAEVLELGYLMLFPTSILVAKQH